MSEITPEKTHQLLEKLADYVMTEVSTKVEVNQKIAQVDEKIDKLVDYVMTEVSTKVEVNQKITQVDEKIDKLAEYVMNEVPKKRETDKLADYVMNQVPTKMEFQELKDKVDRNFGAIDSIIDGLDGQARQLDSIRTEQTAFHHAFGRLEKRVKKSEVST